MFQSSKSSDKYLSQHALLPSGCPDLDGVWEYVIVIPCYNESPGFIDRFWKRFEEQSILLILVINRPISSPKNSNSAVRKHLSQTPSQSANFGYKAYRFSKTLSMLSVDLEQIEGPTDRKQGVGRARRIGCDLALALIKNGTIISEWINSGDADAEWPKTLLCRSWQQGLSAMTLPFKHRIEGEDATSLATLMYELKVHQHQLLLQTIGSPYAFHSLGSSCTLNSVAYAAVRGVPLRNGAEDFYLLNKLAKVAPIEIARGECIEISSRLSNRAPFGTGVAVRKLIKAGDLREVPIFYDARCFAVLHQLLRLFNAWTREPDSPTSAQLTERFGPSIAADLNSLMSGWRFRKALKHLHCAGTSEPLRRSHTNVWFDGFKILKVLHLLRDRHFPNLSFNETLNEPANWSNLRFETPLELRKEIYKKLGWIL